MVDARTNDQKSRQSGFVHEIEPVAVRYIRATITNSTKPENGGHIVELEAYAPAEQTVAPPPSNAVQGSVASVDERYARDRVPDVTHSRFWRRNAWAGERLNGQLLLWGDMAMPELSLSVSRLTNEAGSALAPTALQARFVRYTRGEGGIMPDIIETMQTIPPCSEPVRPVWLTVDVPRDAAPGTYTATVTATTPETSIDFDIHVDVLPLTLTAFPGRFCQTPDSQRLAGQNRHCDG